MALAFATNTMYIYNNNNYELLPVATYIDVTLTFVLTVCFSFILSTHTLFVYKIRGIC